MNEDLDLEALGQEWRELDMKTIEMALETGKLRREVTWGFGLMTVIALCLGGSLLGLAFVASTPWRERLPGVAVVGLCLVLFLWFLRRQRQAVLAADALLTGAPVDLIRGRRALLEIELYAWNSPLARFFELLAWAGGILLATAWWWMGSVSGWWLLAIALALACLSAYVRLHRIPRLRLELTELEDLATSLA